MPFFRGKNARSKTPPRHDVDTPSRRREVQSPRQVPAGPWPKPGGTRSSRSATFLNGRRNLKVPSPIERWDKLKELMAKSPKHQYGRSSNAVATEADVPLRTLQDFIKSGGSPAKYNSEIQDYETAPLKQLAVWIDAQRSGPVPHLTAKTALSEPPQPPVPPPEANAEASKQDQGSSSSSESSSSPPLSLFLASLGAVYVVYEPAIARLLPSTSASAAACHAADTPNVFSGDSSREVSNVQDASIGQSLSNNYARDSCTVAEVSQLEFEVLLDAGVKKAHARKILDAALQHTSDVLTFQT